LAIKHIPKHKKAQFCTAKVSETEDTSVISFEKRKRDLKFHPKCLSKDTKLIINTMLKKNKSKPPKNPFKPQIQKLNIKDLFKEKRTSGPMISCRTPQNNNNWFSLNSNRRLEHTVQVRTKRGGLKKEVLIKRSVSPLKSFKRFSETTSHRRDFRNSDTKGIGFTNFKDLPLKVKLMAETFKNTKKKIQGRPENLKKALGKENISMGTSKKNIIPKPYSFKESPQTLTNDKRISLGVAISKNNQNMSMKQHSLKELTQINHKNSQLRSINKTLQNISYNNLNSKTVPSLKVLTQVKSAKVAPPHCAKLVESNAIFSQASDCLENSVSVKVGLKIPSKDYFSNETETFYNKSSTFLNTATLLQSRQSGYTVKEKKNVITSLRDVVGKENYFKDIGKENGEKCENLKKGESLLLNVQKFGLNEGDRSRATEERQRITPNVQNILSFQKEENVNNFSMSDKMKLILSRKQSISMDNLNFKTEAKDAGKEGDEDKPKWVQKGIMTFRQEVPVPEVEQEQKVPWKSPFESDSKMGTHQENPFKQTESTIKDIQISYLTSHLGNSDSNMVNPIFQNVEGSNQKKNNKFKQESDLNRAKKIKLVPQNQELILEQILENLCPIGSPGKKMKSRRNRNVTSRQKVQKKTKNYSQKYLKTFRRKKSEKENEERSNRRKYNWVKYTTFQTKPAHLRLDCLLKSYKEALLRNKKSKVKRDKRGEGQSRNASASIQKNFRKLKTNYKPDKSHSKIISNKLKQLKRNNSLKQKAKCLKRDSSRNLFNNIYKDYYRTVDTLTSRTTRFGNLRIQNKFKKDFIKKKLNKL
jgi:hypothetical protein